MVRKNQTFYVKSPPPRTMTKEGLRFLGLIVNEQSKIPSDGVILELGPLFGSSTNAISVGRGANSTKKIVSIDTFEAAPWVRKRFGFDLSRERFDHYTKDIANIDVIQGYSPQIVEGVWGHKIDVYFDDATHGNPNWMENYNFFEPYFTEHAVLCGDDFAGGWPDVVKNVELLAQKYETVCYVIGRLWAIGLSKAANEVLQRVVERAYPQIWGHQIQTESSLGNLSLPAAVWSAGLHNAKNNLDRFRILSPGLSDDSSNQEKSSIEGDILRITIGRGGDSKEEYESGDWISAKGISSISISLANKTQNKGFGFQLSIVDGKRSQNTAVVPFGDEYKWKHGELNSLRLGIVQGLFA